MSAEAYKKFIKDLIDTLEIAYRLENEKLKDALLEGNNYITMYFIARRNIIKSISDYIKQKLESYGLKIED